MVNFSKILKLGLTATLFAGFCFGEDVTPPPSSLSVLNNLSTVRSTVSETGLDRTQLNDIMKKNKTEITDATERKVRNQVEGIIRDLTASGEGIEKERALSLVLDNLFPANAASADGKSEDGKAKLNEAEEAAERRAAQKAAKGKELERALERAEDRLFREQQANGAGGGSGRGNSGGNSGESSGGDSSSNSNPFSGFNNNNNSNNQPGNNNDSIDRLANRLGNSQGFGNFSNFQNNPKKEDEKKSNFSLEPSKSSSKSDFSLDSQKPKTVSNLPAVQTALDGASTKPVFQGTPLSPAPYSNSVSGFNGNTGNLNSGVSGQNLGAASPMSMLGGGQAGMNMMNAGAGEFPFDVTGETYDPEAEAEDWPRYRVYPVAMNSSSAGGDSSSGVAGSSEYDSGNYVSTKSRIPQNIYLFSSDEESLKEVPGVFRGLAASYRKTRVQFFCGQKFKNKIGLCQRVSTPDLDS